MARVAQSVERVAFNHNVQGSSPCSGVTQFSFFSTFKHMIASKKNSSVCVHVSSSFLFLFSACRFFFFLHLSLSLLRRISQLVKKYDDTLPGIRSLLSILSCGSKLRRASERRKKKKEEEKNHSYISVERTEICNHQIDFFFAFSFCC